MERHHCDYFDYWGQGTEVTVQSEAATPPTLFPLVQCHSGSEDTLTVGCLAHGFLPKSISFTWSDDSGASLTSVPYPPAQANNKYIGVSVLNVSKSDWDARKSFTCSVTHAGSPQSLQVQRSLPTKVTLLSVPGDDTQTLVCTVEDSVKGTVQSFEWKKSNVELNDYFHSPIQQVGKLYSAVSVLKVKKTDWDSEAVYSCKVTYRGTAYIKKASKALITMTLTPPSPKRIFSDNEAKLDCVVNGQDKVTVDKTEITWQINGQNVTDHITEARKSEGRQYSKISTMTRNYTEWQNVNNVRCSAHGEDMTPVIQDLTVQKGDGRQPKVTVHMLPDKSINQGDSVEVTMMCLVSSPVLADYYITWSDDAGQQFGNYADGINFPLQKTMDGYMVASVYTTTRKKWEQQTIFYCNVWPAGSNGSMKPVGVSKNMDLSSESDLNLPLSCSEDHTEEDEFSSLWSTTCSFIFLFISSLFYNMIFSLVKVKRK
ncbi:immunoglobulin gamma-1 heavy chain-like [Solea senegalensis]|nr:immunoglobulin gamma-1 heavy chain-like [Solea senegalensis]